MDAHLALPNERLKIGMDDLDGIFDGDDVLAAVAIDRIDHARHRRGLTLTGAAGDENQTLAALRERLDHRRQS